MDNSIHVQKEQVCVRILVVHLPLEDLAREAIGYPSLLALNLSHIMNKGKFFKGGKKSFFRFLCVIPWSVTRNYELIPRQEKSLPIWLYPQR